ncbi:MAG TPA: MDR family MFS transporter [Gaiellaceae bacterium]|nr:MDR family MFS transporter [Gaiellaceae bacterium]
MEELTPAARRRVLVGLMLTMALAAMDTTIVATAIPSIVRDLGGFSLFPWVFSGYVLAQAVTIPIYGKLADLYGRKPVLIVGTLIFLAGSILSGIAWSMVALIVFRALQGLGAGAIQPVVTTLAGDLYTLEERARVQGYISSVWGISAVVGPAIGGFFAEYATWRWIFYVNVPIGAAALAVILTGFHEPHVVRRRHRIDVGGAGLLVGGIGLLIFGLLQGGVRWPWVSVQSLATFAVSAALLVAFAFQERRAAEPMLPPWVFGRRILLGAALGSGAVGLLTIGLTTFLPTFAQGVLGAGPVVAGFTLAAMSVGWPVAASQSGRLYLRIGFRDSALIGTGICLVAGILFALLGDGSQVWQAAGACLVMGVGLGLLSTPLIVGVQSVVDWSRRGVVTGASMFTRMLGQALGAAIFGSVANSTLHRWLVQAPPAVAAKLPRSVNAASSVLGGHAPHGAAGDYVRHGLELATHRVFLGLVAVAVLALAALLVTPRRFEQLELESVRIDA